MDMCLSGGAKGSDQIWGIAAANAGHSVVHWSFDGHNIRGVPNLCILRQDQLDTADENLKLAKKSLKRSFPTRTQHVNNLLRRNFYQVNWSDSVYAVSTFADDKSLLRISGGTAWACQMYVDRWMYLGSDISNCNLYLFDQISNKWYSWIGQWMPVVPPKPSGVYAGIGTRDLTESGKSAIFDLYG